MQATENDAGLRRAHGEKDKQLHETPEAREVGLSREHDQLLTSSEEHWQALEALADPALVDAELIDPQAGLSAVVLVLELLPPGLQRAPLRIRIVVPAVGQKAVDAAKRCPCGQVDKLLVGCVR